MPEQSVQQALQELAEDAPTFRAVPTDTVVRRIKRSRTRRAAAVAGTTLAVVAGVIGTTLISVNWSDDRTPVAAGDGACEPARREAETLGKVGKLVKRQRVDAALADMWLDSYLNRWLRARARSDVRKLADGDQVWVCVYSGSGFDDHRRHLRPPDAAVLVVLPDDTARMVKAVTLDSASRGNLVPGPPQNYARLTCGDRFLDKRHWVDTAVRLTLDFPAEVTAGNDRVLKGHARFTNVSNRPVTVYHSTLVNAHLLRDGVMRGAGLDMPLVFADTKLQPGESATMPASVSLARCKTLGQSWNHRPGFLTPGTYELIAVARIQPEGDDGVVVISEPVSITLR